MPKKSLAKDVPSAKPYQVPAAGTEAGDRLLAKMEAAQADMVRALHHIQTSHDLSPNEMTTLLAVLAGRSFMNTPDAGALLPSKAPELWSERDLNMRENAPKFTTRVYAQWIGKGLARRDIARLDPDLYKALSVWLARHPDDEIAQILPSQSDQLDDAIEHLSAFYPIEFLRKLGYAIDTRLRRQKK
jgi:hypothetical protein